MTAPTAPDTRSVASLLSMFEERDSEKILSVDAVQVAAPGVYSVVYALDPSLVTKDTLHMLRSEGLYLLVRSYDFNYESIKISSDGYSLQGHCTCYGDCDCVLLYEASHNDSPDPWSGGSALQALDVTVSLYEIAGS